PRMIVVWPTATPLTSVMEFRSPVGRTPIRRPISRARGRLSVCADTVEMVNIATKNATVVADPSLAIILENTRDTLLTVIQITDFSEESSIKSLGERHRNPKQEEQGRATQAK